MPRIHAGGALGAVGSAKNFVNVLRELSFEELREEAERLPRLLIVAPDREAAVSAALRITGEPESPAVAVATYDTLARSLDEYDVVVACNPKSASALTNLRKRHGDAERVIDVGAVGPDEAWEQLTRDRICEKLPDLAPALGRWFDAFRPAATKAIIDETARTNAQFALVSNIPAVIPVFGSFAAAGADFLILTKNQVMMVYKLAAVHGRALGDAKGIVREMIPVIGAGLLWRTLAREAASFLPFAAGTIPKVLVAFTGTMAAGRAAEFYYQTGGKPSKEQLRGYYHHAAEAVKHLPLAVPKPGRTNGVSEQEAKTPTTVD